VEKRRFSLALSMRLSDALRQHSAFGHSLGCPFFQKHDGQKKNPTDGYNVYTSPSYSGSIKNQKKNQDYQGHYSQLLW
jgi:hypothetical protein